MTTAWLAVTAILVGFAWLTVWARRPTGSRYLSVAALPAAALVAWVALSVPLGKPDALPPAGEYTVLGARIDVDKAIYVLLDGVPDSGGEPRYYKLPYSNKAAEQLQVAMDAGNGVRMQMDGDGETHFHETPVPPDEPKRPERPAMTIGEENAS